MFKAPELLDSLLDYAHVNLDISINDFRNFISLFKVSIKWLTFGLIMHLISRGIWVGMVGLSFTFPKGVDIDKIKLSDKFQNKLSKIPDLEKIIINLEKISSMQFSVSFMMFMVIIGAYLFLFIALVVPITIITRIEGFIWEGAFGVIIAVFVLTVIGIGFLGLIDFLTLGFLKRFKWFTKFYYPIYRLISALTMSRFYRPIYYTLLTNTPKWKIALFLIPFVVISFIWIQGESDETYPGENFSRISMWSNSLGTGLYTGYYDDQMDDIVSVQAQIQSDIIRGNTIRLFIPLIANKEEDIQKYTNYDSLRSLEGLNSAEKMLLSYKNFYQIYLNDSLLMDQEYLFHFKSLTGQKGIMTFIDVSELMKGNYTLTITAPEEIRRNAYAVIPFYREISMPQYEIVNTPASENEEDSYLKLKPILPK